MPNEKGFILERNVSIINKNKNKMTSQKTSPGIWFTTILFIVFLVFKLAEIGIVATWSWWWVTSPIWIPICLTVIGFIIYGIYLVFKINRNEPKEKMRMPKRSFQQRLEERSIGNRNY